MKLYTEEEVKNAISIRLSVGYSPAFQIGDMNSTITKIYKDITPIKLPSDEEIEEMGQDVIIYNDTKRGWFVVGLKVMRDKIQGGNK